jgi:hypothetical protein
MAYRKSSPNDFTRIHEMHAKHHEKLMNHHQKMATKGSKMVELKEEHKSAPKKRGRPPKNESKSEY